MMAILGCSATWITSSCAKISAQSGSPNVALFGGEPVLQPPTIRLHELVAPPGANPSPGRRRQVIDLRDRSVEDPGAVRVEMVSQSQHGQGSNNRVDLAIPQQLFEQAQTAPRPQPSTSGPPASTSGLDQPQFESSRKPPSISEMIVQPSKSDTAPAHTKAGTSGAGQDGENQIPGASGIAIPDRLYGQAEVQPMLGNARQENSDPRQPLLPPSVLEQSHVPSRDPVDQQSESKADGTKTVPLPEFLISASPSSEIDPCANQVDYCPGDFSDYSGPKGSTFDPYAAAHIYRGKFAITTQRPLVELWRPLYTPGVYPPAPTWFGVTNPMKPHFLVYGDMRTALGVNQNNRGKSNVWGNVLNLDMDLQLTSTERVHAFVAPLNRGTQASGVSFNDELDLIDGTNLNLGSLFFEGDAGALLGGARGTYPPFDLPFTFGLIPLVYQNGIWANDAVLGAAVALPARHSRALKWSNFDASLFWATDNITTDAFPNQDSAADFFGTAWFIDAYEGYIESDYAFVNDNTGAGRGYHNISLAFTRRYLHKLSNSVRFIVNAGQEDLPLDKRTADGHLLLIENSLISAYPNTVVPYINLFYGQGRPQSLARIGIAGGILNNTGINFETDAITGYPTLDPTGNNTYGFASGINLLGSQFSHQLILEFAMLQAVGSRQLRRAVGDEYGVGMRYQKPLSHNLIFRTDHMVGFREDASNINGSRFELRWKF